MTEGSELIQEIIPYTYTYDQFTVFFYGDHVFIGGKEYPIGQCCVDMMNLNEAVLKKIARRVKACISAAVDLLTKKTDSAAPLPQLWAVFSADGGIQHLLLQQRCPRRDRTHPPEGRRAPQGGAGQGKPNPGAERIRPNLQPFEGQKAEG